VTSFPPAGNPLDTLLVDTATSVTGLSGRFTQHEFEAALQHHMAAGKLVPQLQPLMLREAAQGLARKWIRRRRPKRDKDGNVLYHPECVFQLGGGNRVWMAQATPADGTAAALLSSLNRSGVNRADDKLQIYIHQRQLVFRQYPHLRVWDEAERLVFGYVDSRLPFVDAEDDEFEIL